MKNKKIGLIILVIMVICSTVNVFASNRVIYKFDPISDNSGNLTLEWRDNTVNVPIQITGYVVLDKNNIEVRYSTGSNIENRNSTFIISNIIEFPLKIRLVENQNNKEQLIDLPNSKDVANHILHLYDRGVISGYPDNTFRPNQYVTREEFATMIVNAGNYTINENASSPFSDVKHTDWSRRFIVTLASRGILSGRGNGIFSPKEHITIGEVIAVIDRTFTITNKQPIFENPTGNHFTITQGNYTSLIRQGVIRREDKFSYPYTPDKKATREECAVLISRVLEQNYKTK
ncbi:S-layer family protein [Natranaerovirga pectinivora]|uniref:S-layer family protein n=1 Tax=Natranaerovirga pectinivora TaxID=682400 RepID=A0A4V2UZY1_9FIRM|nr:S-layer homology domain-containing protein [Natranaerovirga pectinivora]TCT13079.1 S-layer family protein [Natranaerovirga pectinivora]